jgi:hypothetical protein
MAFWLMLLSPFLMDEVEALFIPGLVSFSWHHCRVLDLWLTKHVNTLCHVVGAG